jgi:hypothetical protein
MKYFELSYRYLYGRQVSTSASASSSSSSSSSSVIPYGYRYQHALASSVFFTNNAGRIFDQMLNHVPVMFEGKLNRHQRRAIKMLLLAALCTLTSDPKVIDQICQQHSLDGPQMAVIIKQARRSGKTFALEIGMALLICLCPGIKIGYYSIKKDQANGVLAAVAARVNSDDYGRSLRPVSERCDLKSWAGSEYVGDERSIRAISGQKNAKNVCSSIYLHGDCPARQAPAVAVL